MDWWLPLGQDALMPLVQIDARRGLSPETKKGLLDAVHQALMVAFKIPDHDRVQRFVEHADQDFEIAPGRGPLFTVVDIRAFPGRSVEAKRKLYREICDRFAELGIPADDVVIVVHEIPLQDWGMRGGQAACDVDFGFKPNV